MNTYLKAVDKLEVAIDIALVDYYETGDVSYLLKANHYTLQLAEERRVYDESGGAV